MKKRKNKLYKRKAQETKSKEEIEYERIETILRMRRFKTPEGCGFNGKLHLLLNVCAKKEMIFERLHEEGCQGER